MATHRIALTVIRGFLGAGKTTRLNRILSGDHGRRYAVIVNGYGAVLPRSPAFGESAPLHLPLREQPEEINALAWSADGRTLAFGSQGGAHGWVGQPQAMPECPPVATQSPFGRGRTSP